MSLRTVCLLAALTAPLLTIGCGDSDSTEASVPSQISSESGALTLTVDADTWDPVVGETSVRLSLSDADGPVHAESVTVEPWMIAHGHGSKETLPEHEEHGTWMINQVVYTMPGHWQLNVTAVVDGEAETFEIPAHVE